MLTKQHYTASSIIGVHISGEGNKRNGSSAKISVIQQDGAVHEVLLQTSDAHGSILEQLVLANEGSFFRFIVFINALSSVLDTFNRAAGKPGRVALHQFNRRYGPGRRSRPAAAAHRSSDYAKQGILSVLSRTGAVSSR